MIVSRFKIRTGHPASGPKRWFWVRIYDTPEPLRKISNRVHILQGGEDGTTYDDCVGCVQEVIPRIPEFYDPADQDYLPHDQLRWPEDGFAGVVRLTVPFLTTEIISHEMTHAAVTVLRMNFGMRPQLEGLLAPERPIEEALAYAVGALTDETHEGLYQHGFSDKVVD